MTTMFDTLEYPNGDPARSVQVEIRKLSPKVTDEALDTTNEETVIGLSKVRTTPAGRLEVDLKPTDDLTPTGSMYQAVWTDGTETHYDPVFSVPNSGPAWIGANLESAPAALLTTLEINWQGGWALGTDYTAGQSVNHNNESFISLTDHEATADNEPGQGANWQDHWDYLIQIPSGLMEDGDAAGGDLGGTYPDPTLSSAKQAELDGKQDTSEKDQAGGYAGLDGSGKIQGSAVPAIGLSEYLGEVADEPAMLALSGETGDWVKRNDENRFYILTTTGGSQASDWVGMPTPGEAIVQGESAGGVLSGTYPNPSFASDAAANLPYDNTSSGLTAAQVQAAIDEVAGGSSFAEAFDAKGDLLVGTGDGTYERLPVGGNSKKPIADDSATGGISWIKDFFVNPLDPRWGITGDGTDDTTAINDMLSVIPDYSTVLWPRPSTHYAISAKIPLTKPVRMLSFDGAELRQSGSDKCFEFATDDILVDGLELVGPQHATQNANEQAIGTAGSTAAAPYVDIIVRNNRITGWGMYAVHLKHVYNARVKDNWIEDINAAGVMCLSVIGGWVTDNRIKNIVNATQAYGVALTRDEHDDLVTAPRSSYIRVRRNRINDVTSWEGLDTHGGEHCDFTDNFVEGCLQPIMVGPTDDTANDQQWAPRNVHVRNNTVISGVTDGSKLDGIIFHGAGTSGAVVEYATGSIVGNTVIGYGSEDSSTSAGIRFYKTQSLKVGGNDCTECSPVGIMANYDNFDFSITNNTIIDPWSNSLSATLVDGVSLRSSNNQGYASGNTFAEATKSATTVLENCFHIYNVSGQELHIGDNRAENYARYIYDQTSGSVKGWMPLVTSGENPPSIANGASWTSGAITGTDVVCKLGDPVIVGVNIDLPDGVIAYGKVSGTNALKITIVNHSGSAQDISGATWRLRVCMAGL